ncbi:MAG TPA: amidohydrolase family protein [Dehalococcoidia bacterium]|nr:amidohydrolase family protein [Dehalococcoidia bacterium]
MSYDLVIRNGRIVDGTGLPAYRGDVGIRDGKIVEIGRIHDSDARVLNADGLVVAPGFIDHHTHFDAQNLWDPLASSSCWHGVTTVVTGNCSLSLAPCKPADRDGLVGCFVRVEAISRKALEAGVDWEWLTFGEYLDRLERSRGLNVAGLVGHSAIRQWVMGDEACDRPATPTEIGEMRRLLRESLEAGAIGFSVNQSKHHFREDGKPIPSAVAPREELIELAGVLGELNAGILQINGGSMGVEVDPRDNYEFFKQLARAAGRPIVFNTISQRYQAPESWQEALRLAEEAIAEGYRIYGTGSTTPITFNFTLLNAQVMFDHMPAWHDLMFAPKAERIAAFSDAARRPAFRFDAAEDTTPRNFHKRWELVEIIKTQRPEHRKWENKSVVDLAAAEGKHPVDAFLDLALSEDLETQFNTVMVNGDKPSVAQILRHPGVLVGTSDGGAHTAFLADYGYCTELLGPWVRDRGLMSLEEAVSKLTLVPATIFGLDDRGQIRPGFTADLVVFDPATVGPEKPHLEYDYPAGEGRLVQPARGIRATIVNGEVLTEEGRHTGALPGHVLRNARAVSLV